MTARSKFIANLFAVVILIVLAGCTADKLPQPQSGEEDDCGAAPKTFTRDIQPIINRSCAYAGCHLDGSAPGRFDNYAGLLSRLQNGQFQRRVIELKDDPVRGMPPNFAPEGRPKDLTEEELRQIQCWLEDGFPE